MSIYDRELLRYTAYKNVEKLLDLKHLSGIFLRRGDIDEIKMKQYKDECCCQAEWSPDELFEKIYGAEEATIVRRVIAERSQPGGPADERYLSALGRELEFDSDKFRSLLRTDFGALMDFYHIYHGYDGVLKGGRDRAFGSILLSNAVLPYHEHVEHEIGWRLMLNLEALRIYKEVIAEKQRELENRFHTIPNIKVIPFLYEESDHKTISGKIILTFYAEIRSCEYLRDIFKKYWDGDRPTVIRSLKELHENYRMEDIDRFQKAHPEWYWKRIIYDIDEELLENNVILLLSPAELGYNNIEFPGKLECDCKHPFDFGIDYYYAQIKPLSDPNYNVEFNALGNFEGLDEVKRLLKMPTRREPNYEPLSRVMFKAKNR
ncbi:MAG: hypothetical protein RXS42_08230 [Nitrososphaeria archaeon]